MGGPSISPFFAPEWLRDTWAGPPWLETTKTSPAGTAASYTASSSDIGLRATPSLERTTCGSANGECEGKECTSIGTALRPTLLFATTFTATFGLRAPLIATSGFAPFTSAFGCRLIVPNFFLCRIACCSIFTSASRSAIVISVSSHRATNCWCLVCTVTSAICRYLSVERITCTLPELPTIFTIRASPASACSFSFFVMVVCLPVYSTSIRSPRPCALTRSQDLRRRLAYTTLVRTWNLHIFPILRNGSSAYLDSLPFALGCH